MKRIEVIAETCHCYAMSNKKKNKKIENECTKTEAKTVERIRFMNVMFLSIFKNETKTIVNNKVRSLACQLKCKCHK